MLKKGNNVDVIMHHAMKSVFSQIFIHQVFMENCDAHLRSSVLNTTALGDDDRGC